MSDSIRQKLSYSKETVWGETPATPNLIDLNFTTNSIVANKSVISDATIRSDGQKFKSAQVGFGTTGNIVANHRVGEFNAFYENALQSALTTVTRNGGSVIGEVALVASTSKITFANVTDYNLFKGERVIKVSGSATAGNNKIYFIVSKNDTNRELVVSETIVANDNTTATAGLTLTKTSLVNGNTDGSFLVELNNTGVGKFKATNGVKVGSVAVGITNRQFVTETFNLMGKELFVGNATYGDGTNTASSTKQAVNGSTNVYKVFLDTGDLQAKVTALNFTISRENRERPVVGSLYTNDPGRNQLSVSGNFSLYFENFDLYQKFLDHTTCALVLVIKDVDGNVTCISLPAITLQSVSDDNGGLDQDIMVDFAIDGFGDTTLGHTVYFASLNA